MLFAFVNNNKIEKIQEYSSYEEILDAYRYQLVTEIDHLDPMPKVGWIYTNGKLISNLVPLSPRQLRLALVLSGIDLSMIDAIIDSLPEPDKSFTKIEWEYAIDYERSNVMVESIGAVLNLSHQDIDNIWLLGITL